MDDAIVRCEQASFSYGEERILHGIDLTVRPGEFVSVLGHNGSGKSTLAKLFNGLLTPSAGNVWIAGMNTRDQAHTWEIRRTAGMVFQNPDNQIVATTVEDDIVFGMENLGIARETMIKRLEEVLAVVGLEAFRRHEPHDLSGGQKQRVAIAGILAMRPRLLILDEATAMLDPLGRHEVLDTVRRLNKTDGITIIQITHHLNETILGDRLVVLDRGVVVMDDQPERVFSDPDRLRGIGLGVPFSVEVQAALKKHGISLERTYLTMDELVEGICKFNSNM